MQFGIPGRDDSESMFPPIESFDRRIIDSPSALNIQLTPGEIQVAALVREGLTTKEIAGTLNIQLTRSISIGKISEVNWD